MPDRVAIVTGASAGIGLQTAIGLARAGLRVVMVGRDARRTEHARRAAAQASGSQRIETALADFASLAAVRDLARELLARQDRLDVLVNNAGLMAPDYRQTRDGFEMTLAVNHLAPFLLTNLLLDRLRTSAPARVVTVASEAHRRSRVDLADLARNGGKGGLGAYGRSKLFNIMFTQELARRLEGSGVVAVCLHPGVIATAIGDRGGVLVGLGWRLIKPFLAGPERGAQTSIFLATAPDPTPFNGAYVIGKRVAQPDPAALDPTLARRLWEESARLVGL